MHSREEILAARAYHRAVLKDWLQLHSTKVAERVHNYAIKHEGFGEVNLDAAYTALLAYAWEVHNVGRVVAATAAELIVAQQPDRTAFFACMETARRCAVHTLTEVISGAIADEHSECNSATWQFVDIVVHELAERSETEIVEDAVSKMLGKDDWN